MENQKGIKLDSPPKLEDIESNNIFISIRYKDTIFHSSNNSIDENEFHYFYEENGIKILYPSDIECSIPLNINKESGESFINDMILPRFNELREMIKDNPYLSMEDDDYSFEMDKDSINDSLESFLESREYLFDSLSQLNYYIYELR